VKIFRQEHFVNERRSACPRLSQSIIKSKRLKGEERSRIARGGDDRERRGRSQWCPQAGHMHLMHAWIHHPPFPCGVAFHHQQGRAHKAFISRRRARRAAPHRYPAPRQRGARSKGTEGVPSRARSPGRQGWAGTGTPRTRGHWVLCCCCQPPAARAYGTVGQPIHPRLAARTSTIRRRPGTRTCGCRERAWRGRAPGDLGLLECLGNWHGCGCGKGAGIRVDGSRRGARGRG
jgi:hypothetical protein